MTSVLSTFHRYLVPLTKLSTSFLLLCCSLFELASSLKGLLVHLITSEFVKPSKTAAYLCFGRELSGPSVKELAYNTSIAICCRVRPIRANTLQPSVQTCRDVKLEGITKVGTWTGEVRVNHYLTDPRKHDKEKHFLAQNKDSDFASISEPLVSKV